MTKRTKKQHVDDDPFSQLPDDILVIILSFLTLKEAGRTSVLSFRWTDLWKHTPSLNFEDESALLRVQKHYRQWSREIPKYVEWVERVLKLSNASSLKQFNVHFYFNDSHWKSIEKWIRFAFSHHVEKLELHVLPCDDAMEWCHSFTNELFYNNSVNAVQSTIEFKPLRVLSLKEIDISGKDLNIFLLYCPFLEHIVVWYSYKLCSLEISGPTLKLKFLEIHHCCLQFLKVCNTNLASLSVSTDQQPTLLLENVPSLVDVSLVFSEDRITIEGVPPLLSSCILQLEALEVLVKDPENIMRLLEFPEFTKLKKLVLVVYQSSKFKYIRKLVPLIRFTPCLEEFFLEYNSCSSIFCKPAKSTRLRNQIVTKFDGYSLRFLKVVKISGFPCQNSDFDFIRYFVENAVCLQKIIIDPLKPKHPRPELEAAEHRQRIRNLAKEFAEELPQHIDWVFVD